MTLEPTISLGTDAPSRLDKSEMDRVTRDLSFFGRGLRASITLGGQMGGARACNVTVFDGRNRHVGGVFLVRVWIGPTLGGAHGGTQTTVVTKGSLVQALVAGQLLEVLTDDKGEASIDVDGAAGSRACHAVVLGGVFGVDGSWS